MRKYNPQRFGLNPEWVNHYIKRPLTKIVIIGLALFALFTYCKIYAEHKAQEEHEHQVIQESISAEESIIAESKRAKEIAMQEEEAKKESLAKIEIEKRKTNALWEDKVTKKVIDGKKYWRNNKTKKVGKVDRIYGLEVVTNNDWSFTLNGNGNIPEEVVNIGYAEYAKTLKKQKEAEEKKNRIENASKIQKLIDEELREQTEQTKAKFHNLTHFKLGTKYYRVMKIIGSDIIALEHKKRDKKSNYETLPYSDAMIPIDYNTYELER